MATAPEFSRLVPLARIGREPLQQDIEASPQEREALARRFDLLSLDRLSAAVVLRRRGPSAILLEARFEAAFTQECIISLEPVAGSVSESFALRYGPPEAASRELELTSEEDAFEPLDGEAIDIGEAVAQELSLALPTAPRLPDAVIEEAAGEKTDDGPFASLRRLVKG
jgi:uncharacterized metal-binding protein YceD (DUF177 family)